MLAAPRGLSQLGYVLLRLWTPRHPPYTLCSLTIFFIRSTFSAIHFCFQRSPQAPSRSRLFISSKIISSAWLALRSSPLDERVSPRKTHLSRVAGTYRSCARLERDSRTSGGGDGTRTHDPLVANQVLYQLSYAPSGIPKVRVRSKALRTKPVCLHKCGAHSEQHTFAPGPKPGWHTSWWA